MVTAISDMEEQKKEEVKKEEEAPAPVARSLPPPTHSTGYRPPVQPSNPSIPRKVNHEKLPAFYFSGNVEITSDGNGNINLTFKQH